MRSHCKFDDCIPYASTHSLDDHPSADDRHGRHAQRPLEIPARGWWDIAMRVKNEMTTGNVSIIAAGLALYALLAVFPALAAAVSIYGLFASPADIAEYLRQVAATLPEDGARILERQVADLSQQQQALSIGVVVGILLALWSARKGMARR